jgi:hypothetical protein
MLFLPFQSQFTQILRTLQPLQIRQALRVVNYSNTPNSQHAYISCYGAADEELRCGVLDRVEDESIVDNSCVQDVF